MGAIGKVFAEAVKQALRVFQGSVTPAQIAKAADAVREVAVQATKAKR